MYFSVTSELYHQTAVRLVDVIGGSDYFSGSIAFAYGDVDCRLTTSVIVYRREEQAPDEGVAQPIVDCIPVWWEFHTVGPDGEMINDFSFSELKSWIC